MKRAARKCGWCDGAFQPINDSHTYCSVPCRAAFQRDRSSSRTHKPCTLCKVDQPLSNYYPDKRAADGTQGKCKECQKSYQVEAYARKHSLRVERKYGLSRKGYDGLLRSQGGGCAICGAETDPNGRRLSVDHCHETGSVRGILCSNCNLGLGNMADDIERMESAQKYLLQSMDILGPLLGEQHETSEEGFADAIG